MLLEKNLGKNLRDIPVDRLPSAQETGQLIVLKRPIDGRWAGKTTVVDSLDQLDVSKTDWRPQILTLMESKS